MIKQITPAEAGREAEYNMWIQNTVPMASLTTTFDITNLVHVSKKRKMKMNMLMCYCIGRAASQVKEFYTLVLGKNFYISDRLAVQTIIKDKAGALRFCDIEIAESLAEYAARYERITREAWERCEDYCEEEAIFIGVSCTSTTLVVDSAVNQYNEKFPNPFLVWGAFKKKFPNRKLLPITLQFHHVQMNGDAVCRFMELLQEEIKKL